MRILVIRIGRAGDIVMITPALSALLETYPDADYTILTSKDGNRLLHNYDSRINDIWVWDRSSLTSPLQKIRLKRKLKENSFDIIICFETSKSIRKLFSNAPSTYYWNSGTTKSIHTARHYLNLIEKVCSKKLNDIPVNLPVPSEASKQVNSELAAIGISQDDTLVMLHPSNSGYSKFSLRKRKTLKHRLWPAQNFSELGKLLNELSTRSSLKIIIDLLPEEKNLGDEIVSQSNETITLLSEKPNFERYKALLKRADLFVSPNTGPMHIAAAVNTCVVALFSGWNPVDCGPFMDPENYSVIRAEDTENPEQGLSAISATTVLEACKKYLL